MSRKTQQYLGLNCISQKCIESDREGNIIHTFQMVESKSDLYCYTGYASTLLPLMCSNTNFEQSISSMLLACMVQSVPLVGLS